MVNPGPGRKPAAINHAAPRTWVRPAAVAGAFYPDNATELQELLLRFGQQVRLETALPIPCAIIAPHAGYAYSGPIAAHAYEALRPAVGQIDRVVLLGPSHRVAFSGLALSSAAAFDCPLGRVAIDRNAMFELADLPSVRVIDRAHEHEHGLEVHLPFLIHTLRFDAHPFTLAPLVVGDASARDVAMVLEHFLGYPRTLIVVSSDLSHYLDYDSAQRLDRKTSDAIEALAPEKIGPEQACGRLAIQGLLHLAAEAGLTARTLDLRNSGDTAGPRDRVVGYGAYILHA